jgi:alcohol dehydrogenase class IV
MLPRVALIDPELTIGLPPAITAMTGLDALTQLIEPFVSNRANPMTDLLCRDGIVRAARSLRRAYEFADDTEARHDMALAALYSGMALANARLGAVHGFAGPLGGMIRAPHGALCARLLPAVMASNVRALRERDPSGESLARYTEVARLLTANPDATIDDGQAWIEALCTALSVPPLGAYGLTMADLPLLMANASKASSMHGNPIRLTEREMEEILLRAL